MPRFTPTLTVARRFSALPWAVSFGATGFDAPIAIGARTRESANRVPNINSLLGLSGQRDVARIKRSAERKLAEVNKRIAALERVQGALSELIAKCPGHGRADDCPILKALGAEHLQ